MGRDAEESQVGKIRFHLIVVSLPKFGQGISNLLKEGHCLVCDNVDVSQSFILDAVQQKLCMENHV